MQTLWQERFSKKNKPAYADLLNFFSPDIKDLFIKFDYEMGMRFGVKNKYHVFSDAHGWTYGYGRSYNCVLLTVTVGDNFFAVQNIPVTDGSSLEEALQKANDKYEKGFEKYCSDVSAKRRADQIERSKKRAARENNEMEIILDNIDKNKLNRFNWQKKVSRNDLLRLYQSEAKGIADEFLLDDVGISFYLRCKQAKEIRDLMERGQMQCFNCGAVLQATGYANLTACACGHFYTYREYRRNCNAVNMPGGRAVPVFNKFIDQWPVCKTPSEKMMLIDWLIHECHVTLMSGNKGRSVCKNLIEGSIGQITELINKLAYDANI